MKSAMERSFEWHALALPQKLTTTRHGQVALKERLRFCPGAAESLHQIYLGPVVEPTPLKKYDRQLG